MTPSSDSTFFIKNENRLLPLYVHNGHDGAAVFCFLNPDMRMLENDCN